PNCTPDGQLKPDFVLTPELKDNVALAKQQMKVRQSAYRDGRIKGSIPQRQKEWNSGSTRSNTYNQGSGGSGTVTETMNCPQHMVGRIIGTGGLIIKELMANSGCRIQIVQDGIPEGMPRPVNISGTAMQVQVGVKLVQDIIQSDQQVGSGSRRPNTYYPHSQGGRQGKGGKGLGKSNNPGAGVDTNHHSQGGRQSKGKGKGKSNNHGARAGSNSKVDEKSVISKVTITKDNLRPMVNTDDSKVRAYSDYGTLEQQVADNSANAKRLHNLGVTCRNFPKKFEEFRSRKNTVMDGIHKKGPSAVSTENMFSQLTELTEIEIVPVQNPGARVQLTVNGFPGHCNENNLDAKGIYMYGDNNQDKNLPTPGCHQAGIRHKHNSAGIPTCLTSQEAFSDDAFSDNVEIMSKAFQEAKDRWDTGKYDFVVFPGDGMGSGIANLAEAAPHTWREFIRLQQDFTKYVQETETRLTCNVMIMESQRQPLAPPSTATVQLCIRHLDATVTHMSVSTNMTLQDLSHQLFGQQDQQHLKYLNSSSSDEFQQTFADLGVQNQTTPPSIQHHLQSVITVYKDSGRISASSTPASSTPASSTP
ncbi:MAG TPA: hypothetical protein EYO58_09100, partial [Flavobacteriales bacterium]|nr:hypothetical protein [Flavobacteriales bacterium]